MCYGRYVLRTHSRRGVIELLKSTLRFASPRKGRWAASRKIRGAPRCLVRGKARDCKAMHASRKREAHIGGHAAFYSKQLTISHPTRRALPQSFSEVYSGF